MPSCLKQCQDSPCETDDGLCLDFGDFTHALQLAIEIDEDGRKATGWAFSEENAILIDRDAGQVQFGSSYPRPADLDRY